METKIQNFGECSIPSPADYEYYTSDTSRLIFRTVFQSKEDWNSYVQEGPDFFEQAGPREKIYFNPQEVTAGIVTCGGALPWNQRRDSWNRNGTLLSLRSFQNFRFSLWVSRSCKEILSSAN